jgi:cytoskeletal protein RodZ
MEPQSPRPASTAKDSASSAKRMASFGDRLRQERKARNIRLSEVAESTKIRKVYLQALESNEFDGLPGGVFNKGFVRAYAECIGIDPGAMIGAYEDEQRAQDRRRRETAAGENGAPESGSSARMVPAAPGTIPVRLRRPLVVLATLSTLAALSITIWVLRSGAPSAGLTTPPPPATRVPAPAAVDGPSAGLTTPPPPATRVPAPAAADGPSAGTTTPPPPATRVPAPAAADGPSAGMTTPPPPATRVSAPAAADGPSAGTTTPPPPATRVPAPACACASRSR